MAETVEFETVSLEEWQQIPAPVPPKPKDRFETLLTQVGEGKIVRLDVKEEKELRGMRIGIARKARNAGFITEFRNLGTTLYVRRSEKQLEEKPERSETENKEKKRSRKQEITQAS